jgi:hypothetical protein
MINKKRPRWILLAIVFSAPAVFLTCGPAQQPTAPERSPVSFSANTEERRVEAMHARVFKQLGGYKGPEACYACHQKEYEDVSQSYHVHQGRITKDGKIAHDPKDSWISACSTAGIRFPIPTG